MAITTQMRTDVSGLYVALFGRAPDSEGLGYWVQQLDQGQTLAQIADAMYATAPARAYYPGYLTNEEIIGNFYSNVLGRPADSEGLAFWTGKLNEPGATPGSVIAEMINVVSNYDGADEAGLKSAALFQNKVTVAQWYGENIGAIDGSSDVLTLVTDDPASVAAAEAAATAPSTSATYLTVGQDVVTGTAVADHFVANVVQNNLGAQVNTLGSGDVIDGGRSVDTLDAKVTSGVFAGSNGALPNSMPIQPEVKNVENINLQAVIAGIMPQGSALPGNINSYLNNDIVFVNGKDIQDIRNISSVHSDASLVLQNLTTEQSDGTVGKLSDITVGMKYSGNPDHMWAQSDMDVYFDQDYLVPEATSTRPTIEMRLMNEDSYDVTNGAKPLDGVFVAKMAFVLDGKSYDLAPYLNQGAPGNQLVVNTYAELLAAVQAAIVKLQAANPTDAALQTLTATLGSTFQSDISPITGEWRSGTSIQLSVAGLTNGTQNTLTTSANDLTLNRADGATVENNNRYERAENNPPVEGQKLAINVNLEKAGLDGDGGHLIIGSMFKDGTNTWQDKYAGKGINEFDVTVSGGSDKPSSLSELASTGNNLQTVKVVTDAAQTGTYADLAIGNGNTLGSSTGSPIGPISLPGTLGELTTNANALKDVQTFDATGFKGDLTLYAALTEEVTAKYMDLKDAAPALAPADNQLFKYDGGTGNDYINLAISSANLSNAGTTTREDFNLSLNGNDGNDTLVASIQEESDDGSSVLAHTSRGTDAWYVNSKLNANLNVSGGAGNDTIAIRGSGDWVVKGGDGNDAIYVGNSDNSSDSDPTNPSFLPVGDGHMASWVFNAASLNGGGLENITSDANDTYAGIYKGKLSISFTHAADDLDVYEGTYTSKSVVISSNVNYNITDLDINQAIKAAINSDPVLSKLLVATDGPANSLVVTSLIDGKEVAGDLMVNWAGPSASELNQADVTAYNRTQGTSLATTTDLANAIASKLGAVSAGGDYNALLANAGDRAHHTADNHIYGDAGNDVMVLGTGWASNDTVVYTGFGNGTDTIVNFIDGKATTYWNSSSYEIATLDFSASDGDPAAETIVFDGVTVHLAAPSGQGVIPALDVATQFADQYNAAAGTHWTAEVTDPANGVVTLTHKTPGAVTDLTAAALTGTYFATDPNPNGGGSVAVSTSNDAVDIPVPGSPTTFTVTFDTATTAVTAAGAAADISFAGTTIDLAQGDGALSVATKVAAGAYAGWTVGAVVDNGNGTSYSVTFTEGTHAPTALPTTGFGVDSASTTDGINGSLAGTVGVADSTTPPALVTTYSPGIDMLDFSSYKVAGVFVDGALVKGAAPVTGQNYITLVEGTGAAAGSYTMTEMTEAGALGTAGDTVVGVIGVANFGAHQTFIDQNFVI